MESAPSIPRTLSDGSRDFERRRLIAWRQSLDPHQRYQADLRIGERLAQIVLARRPAGVLGLYWPIRGEPDLRGGLVSLIESGWRLALPSVTGRDRPLEFGHWTPGQAMRAVSFGLMLPDPFEPVLPDLLVIPCVGFDRRGYRLGYGAGFYDRTLAERPVPAVGVAYDGCELTAFAALPHDRALDWVVTETRTLGSPAAGRTPAAGQRP